MTAWLVSGLLILLGLIFLIVGLVSNSRAKKALSFPITRGTILTTGVNTYTDTTNGIRNTTYEPVVTYQYSLMGQDYTGNRIRYGANRMKHDEAYQIIEKYPVGLQVNVYYNPDKVKDATLEPVAQGSKVFIILGLIMVAFGVAAFFIL